MLECSDLISRCGSIGHDLRKLYFIEESTEFYTQYYKELLRQAVRHRDAILMYVRTYWPKDAGRRMDLRLEFCLYPKSFDGRIAQCPDAVRLAKLMYFKLAPQLDKPVLTNDCGSDVSAGAEKDELWDWNRCACHCLNIAVQAAFKEPMIEGCLASLTALARRFSHNWSACLFV